MYMCNVHAHVQVLKWDTSHCVVTAVSVVVSGKLPFKKHPLRKQRPCYVRAQMAHTHNNGSLRVLVNFCAPPLVCDAK